MGATDANAVLFGRDATKELRTFVVDDETFGWICFCCVLDDLFAIDELDGLDKLAIEDEELLMSDEICWTLLPDDCSISLSKSIIRSPIPPTSHSLSSYSKLLSFDSDDTVVCC